MCEGKKLENCKPEACKTFGTLTRLKKAEESQKSGFGRWAYNSCFIAQLMAQKENRPSDKRINRKNPHPALNVYKQTQKIIARDLGEPLAKST